MCGEAYHREGGCLGKGELMRLRPWWTVTIQVQACAKKERWTTAVAEVYVKRLRGAMSSYGLSKVAPIKCGGKTESLWDGKKVCRSSLGVFRQGFWALGYFCGAFVK